jgi:hypothetical protein
MKMPKEMTKEELEALPLYDFSRPSVLMPLEDDDLVAVRVGEDFFTLGKYKDGGWWRRKFT